jgi:hypothetical protein
VSKGDNPDDTQSKVQRVLFSQKEIFVMKILKSALMGINNKPKVAKSGKSFEKIKATGMIVEINSDHEVCEIHRNYWYIEGHYLQLSRQTKTYHVYKEGDTYTTVHHSGPLVFINNIGGCKLRRHEDGTIEAFYPKYGSIFSEPNTSHVTLKADSLDKLHGLACLHRYANFRSTVIKQTTETDDCIRIEYKKVNFMKQYPYV